MSLIGNLAFVGYIPCLTEILVIALFLFNIHCSFHLALNRSRKAKLHPESVQRRGFTLLTNF